MASELVRRFQQNVRLVKALRQTKQYEDDLPSLDELQRIAEGLRIEPNIMLSPAMVWWIKQTKEAGDG